MSEKVCPREPTVVMVNEGVNVMRVTGGDVFDDAKCMWRAMYDVAPPAPTPAAPDERKRFEAWAVGNKLDLSTFDSCPQKYVDGVTACAWQAWLVAPARTESALASERARNDRFVQLLRGAAHALRSYQYGNGSPDLAEGMADKIAAALDSKVEP